MARKHDQQWWKEQKAVEKTLNKLGYRTRQQPGSGNRDITLSNDVVWHDSPIGHLEIECKWRETSLWKSLLKWMGGADLLTLKCHENRKDQDGRRYVVLRWDTFLALVGSAADRSEHLHELPEVVPDKPWITENLRNPPECPDCHKYQWHCLTCDRPVKSDNSHYSPDFFDPLAIAQEQDRRARIQAAHQNPPQRKPKPRGFGK